MRGEKKQESSNDLGNHILLDLCLRLQKKTNFRKDKKRKTSKGGIRSSSRLVVKKKKIEKQKNRNRKQGGIPADPPSPSRHGRTSGSQLPLRTVYISPHTSTVRLLRLSEDHL